MRKLLTILFMLLSMLLIPNISKGFCHDKAGNFYWDDAQNYLIYSSGNHGGSAIDLSSVIIIKDTANYMIIEGLDYFYWDNKIRPAKYGFFLESKEGRDIYCDSANSLEECNNWQRITWLQGEKAYLIIKQHALSNTIKNNK